MSHWTLSVRVLHWITAGALAIQLIVVFGLQGPGSAMFIWMPWHITLGFSLLALAALRVGARALPPRRLASSSGIATAMHVALYLVLILTVLTGWFAYRPAALMPTPLVFGVIPLRPIHLPFAVPWIAWHQALVWILITLVIGHGVAAAYHFLVLRDRVLQRMLRSDRASKRDPSD